MLGLFVNIAMDVYDAIAGYKKIAGVLSLGWTFESKAEKYKTCWTLELNTHVSQHPWVILTVTKKGERPIAGTPRNILLYFEQLGVLCSLNIECVELEHTHFQCHIL